MYRCHYRSIFPLPQLIKHHHHSGYRIWGRWQEGWIWIQSGTICYKNLPNSTWCVRSHSSKQLLFIFLWKASPKTSLVIEKPSTSHLDIKDGYHLLKTLLKNKHPWCHDRCWLMKGKSDDWKGQVQHNSLASSEQLQASGRATSLTTPFIFNIKQTLPFSKILLNNLRVWRGASVYSHVIAEEYLSSDKSR